MLYLFVEKYNKSLLKPLRSFAEGLKRDIDAVENAVASDYSNGFVEVNNPVPVSLLSGDRKPQIRFLGNHHSGSGNLYHKSFRM